MPFRPPGRVPSEVVAPGQKFATGNRHLLCVTFLGMRQVMARWKICITLGCKSFSLVGNKCEVKVADNAYLYTVNVAYLDPCPLVM